MARAHFVKKARKAHKAGDIKKGDSYYWWAFMQGGRGGPKHYSKTPPKRSQLTQSDYLGQLYDLEDEIADLKAEDGDSIESTVADIAERLRQLGSEQTEKKDNMPEGLQEGDTGNMLQERAEACENAADELEAITFDVSDKEDSQTAEEYWQEKIDEAQAVSIDS